MNPRTIVPIAVVLLLALVGMAPAQTEAGAAAQGSNAGASAAPAPAATTGSDPAPSPGAVSDSPFTLGVNDLISVEVWREPQISSKVPVRPDGKIALPLIGELQAAGLTPAQLRSTITTRLRSFISDPSVTVEVDQVNSRKFNVLGRVQRPGSYPLEPRMGVLDAIAQAGGMAPFSHNTVYILRPQPDGSVLKIPVDYKSLIDGKDGAQNTPLALGDTVVVH